MLHLVYDQEEIRGDAGMRDIAATTLGLVEHLYEAVANPEAWPAFLEALGDAVQGVVPAIYVMDVASDRNRVHLVSGGGPAWESAYEASFKQRALRRARIKELPAGSAFIGNAL